MRKATPQPGTTSTRGRGTRLAAGKEGTAGRSALLTKQPFGLLGYLPADHEAREVCFEYYNPTAKSVAVAGSFNSWQPETTAMNQARGGRWSVVLLLPPGRYEYRLVVDDQWLDDPLAAQYVANPFGSLNGVIEVKPTAVVTP